MTAVSTPSARPQMPRKDLIARTMAALRCRIGQGGCLTHRAALYPTGDCPTAVKAVEAIIAHVAAHAWDEGACNRPEQIQIEKGHVVGNPYVFRT